MPEDRISKSHIEKLITVCPSCQQKFETDVWLIIDTHERPDLVRFIHQGKVHETACPSCRSVFDMNSSVLILQVDKRPAVFFALASQLTDQVNQEILSYCISLLKEKLQESWSDEWIKGGVPYVPRKLLSDALDDFDRVSKIWNSGREVQSAFSQALRVVCRCPNCETLFNAEVWAIIDTVGSPDLVKRISLGTLHQVECPRCESSAKLDSPFLLFRRDQQPPILFCRHDGMPAEANTGVLGELIENLKSSLGSNWQEDWIERGIIGISQSVLPSVIYNLDAYLAMAGAIPSRGENESSPAKLTAGSTIDSLLEEINNSTASKQWDRSIHLCRQAISQIDRNEYAEVWGTLHTILGSALAENHQNGGDSGIFQAREAYEIALQVFSLQYHPDKWADTMVNLACVCAMDRDNNKEDWLDRGRRLIEQALTYYTPTSNPPKWAWAKTNLATFYLKDDPVLGNQRAAEIYQDIIACMDPVIHALEWTQAALWLGLFYTERVDGDRVTNVQRALDLYETILRVLPRHRYPLEWAKATYCLANALLDVTWGSANDNLDRAIQLHLDALVIYRRETFPSEWALGKMNLGLAYFLRNRGDKADNIEQAIRAYDQALEVLTRTAHPRNWADTMSNRASAYAGRLYGNIKNNQEEALKSLCGALEIYTLDSDPIKWATLNINLSALYVGSVGGIRRKNLLRAIGCAKDAMRVFTSATSPRHWAFAALNMAKATAELSVHVEARGDYIEESIKISQEVQQVITVQSMPEAWATLMANLGDMFHRRVVGNREDNINRAIEAYNASLRVRTREAMPAEHRATLFCLASLYFEEHRWREAFEVLIGAMKVSRENLVASYIDSGRFYEVWASSKLYPMAVCSLIRMDRLDEAFQQLESGKTRLLTEALSYSDVRLMSGEEREALNKARQAIRVLESEYRMNSEDRRRERELAGALEAARRHFNRLLQGVASSYRDSIYDQPSVSEISAGLPLGTAIVAPIFTSRGSFVFIITPGIKAIDPEHLVELESFSEQDLIAIVFGAPVDPKFLPDDAEELPLAIGKEIDGVMNHYWLPAYQVFKKYGGSLAGTFEFWSAAMEEILGRVWNKLAAPIHSRLSGLSVEKIIFIPQGGLQLIPIHAAWRLENGKRRFLLDDYEISYAPSCRLLRAAKDRIASQSHNAALVAGINNYSKRPLQYSRPEAETIAHILGSTPLLDEEVTRQAILSRSREIGYCHLSCHGGYSWQGDALASALLLFEDEITLSDILTRMDLDASRLVTLSACETGIIEFSKSPDEFLGFPAAFMHAGAPGVVSSLWLVDDRSTSLLMQRFYENHLHCGMSVAGALRAAQSWLRNLKRSEVADFYMQAGRVEDGDEVLSCGSPDDMLYEDIFYWAPFTLNGL